MDITRLNQLIEQNYIRINKHPEQELYIYNYTQNAQYERVWNEITIQCRGLILNEKYEIVARPFPKFFNLGEMENQNIPNLPYEVFDKLDGSLGILYWIDDTPFIASRGSFSSEQAIKATEMLHQKYQSTWVHLDRNCTYLFEIIYPENRIVLDYGNAEKLILLAVIDNQSGADCPLEDIGFPVVKKYDGINDFQTLKNLNLENKEGFVIRFSNGFRMKIKFDEYLRLHRIVTEVSNVTIWEHLRLGMPFDEILDQVPDEFFDFVNATKTQLEEKYSEIEKICQSDFKILETVKETALYYQTKQYPAILFFMMKQRDYKDLIWKYIKPEFQKPFSNFDRDDF